MKEKAKPAAVPPAETSSHIEVKPLYTPAELSEWDQDVQVGYPGEPLVMRIADLAGA